MTPNFALGKLSLENNVNKDPASKCWNWKGFKDRNGYGYGNFTDINERLARRAAYIYFVDTLPTGGRLSNTCSNPSCCNPDHLRLSLPKAYDGSKSNATTVTEISDALFLCRQTVDNLEKLFGDVATLQKWFEGGAVPWDTVYRRLTAMELGKR